jgi:S1-C subfamily serine protease
MKARLLLVTMFLLPAGVAEAAALEDSVVKVLSMIRPPNPIRPWIPQNTVEFSGSGVVIDGHRILTNAHLVTYASQVRVQGRRGGRWIEAKVEACGPGIDLAVLKLDDETFFADRPPLPRAPKLPAVTAGVAVYGYPIGGTGLSVTRGTVSRIDYDALDAVTGALQIQVDAVINPGNSGGPAMVADQMVGLVYGQDENIGYVLANEEIDTFLVDVKDGRYDGKPRLLDRFQRLENDAIRAKLGLAADVEGIMVRRPERAEPSYPLREYDVITRIGDRAIDGEGMVQVEENLRLPFTYMVPKLAQDDCVPAVVLRQGKQTSVRLPVVKGERRLIRSYTGEPPSYFVVGPLVFSPVMSQAVSMYYRANPMLAVDDNPLLRRRNDRAQFPGEALVVVTSPLLQHRITRGYNDPFGQVVQDINGVEIRSLPHLVEVIRDCKDEFLTFRFAGDFSETLVFRRKELEASTSELMAENGIPRRGSADILIVWDPKDGVAH